MATHASHSIKKGLAGSGDHEVISLYEVKLLMNKAKEGFVAICF